MNQPLTAHIEAHGTFIASQTAVDAVRKMKKFDIINKIRGGRPGIDSNPKSVTYWFGFPKSTLVVIAADMFGSEFPEPIVVETVGAIGELDLPGAQDAD